MIIETNGGTTQYEIAGKGDPLVLMHGFEFRETYEKAKDVLCERWTVITYDQRDSGDSEFPPSPYGMGDLADDLAALITGLGYKKAHVLGNSFSGPIALEMGIRHPDLVDRLIVTASVHHTTGSVALVKPEVRKAIDGMNKGDLAASRRLTEMYFDPRSLAREPGLVDEELSKRFPRDASQLARRSAAIFDYDGRGRIGQIQAPTLVLHGRSDPVTNPAGSLAMALEIPYATFIMLDGIGHIWAVEAPDLVSEIITSFLNGSLGAPN